MAQNSGETDVQRWLHLRAIEWAAWPAFVSQPLVPVLFIFVPWTWIIIALLCSDFIWCVFGYGLISVSLSKLSSYFVVIFKWPAAVGSSIYLVAQRRYLTALVALLWPLLAGFISAPARFLFGLFGRPREIGRIELALAKRIGYVDQDVQL